MEGWDKTLYYHGVVSDTYTKLNLKNDTYEDYNSCFINYLKFIALVDSILIIITK